MAGPVLYMRLPGQWRALRVSAAETWLTVYRRRLISDVDMTFKFLCGDLSGVANLFWL